MATAYTSLLGLALPVTGELSGSWGDTINTAITSLLDTAVAGTTSITTDADITLSTTTGIANQARQAIILWNPASGTVTRNITAPAQSKIYTVINASGGTQSIVFRGAGPTTGVTIIKGESAVVAWNGTDFIKVSNTGGAGSFTNVTISGTTTLSGLTASTALALDASKNVVSVTNTGTGNNVLSASPTLTGTVAGASLSLSSLTATRVPFAGVAGLLSDSVNMTFDGTRLTVADLADSGLTSGRVTYASTGGALVDSAALTFDGKVLGVNYAGGGFAWGGSTYNALDLSVYGSVYSASTVAGVTGNAYFNGTAWSVKTSAPSTRYDQTNGTHVFFTAPTPAGLGNTTPTFTQALLLDSTGASFNGSVTLSGGTANGVAYLNGSKVLTTGSALVFDGSRLGVGASPVTPLYVKATAGGTDPTVVTGERVRIQSNDTVGRSTYLSLIAGTSAFSGVFFGDQDAADVGLIRYLHTDNSMTFNTSGSEQMRLTSTGLGIGTSSPGVKLQVSLDDPTGTIGPRITGATDPSKQLRLSYNTTGNYANIQAIQAGTAYTNLVLQQDGGNLGIGTSSPGDRLTVSGSIGFTGGRGDGFAVKWPDWRMYNSSSGNAFVWDNYSTERMRLDASGNLGLGVTPSAWGTSEYKAVQVGNGASFYGRVTAGDEDKAGFSANAFNNGTNWRYIATDSASRYDQIGGGHFWYTAPSGTAGNAISFTQAMTLDASGNLGVGTTSPIGRLDVTGNYARFFENASGAEVYLRGYFGSANVAAIQVVTNSPLAFLTNNTERARIDTSGNLLVGTTAQQTGGNGKLSVAGGSGGAITLTNNSNATFYTAEIYNYTTATGAGAGRYVRFSMGSTPTITGSIVGDGTSTSYNTSSDYRLKNTIAPMTGALAKIAALKPCTYKWNADGSDGQGFIAHELAEVVPQCVTGQKDAVDAEGKPQYQGIDTSFLVATLTAAIQELKAEFDAYKATHP